VKTKKGRKMRRQSQGLAWGKKARHILSKWGERRKRLGEESALVATKEKALLACYFILQRIEEENCQGKS